MKTKLLLALFCAVMVRTAPAAIIDFSTGSATDNGTSCYAGGAAPLIGANIGVGLVRGIGTPSNSGVTDPITAGLLNFTSGAFISYSAAADEYFFGGGGTITISGSGRGCT